MLSISSSMRSTPTAGMKVVLGLFPLDLHAEQLCTKVRVCTGVNLREKWDGVGHSVISLRRYHDNTLEGICPRGLPIDQINRSRDWVRDDIVEDPDLTLFTDGSKMECGSGSGWAVCHGDTVIAEDSIYLGSDTSVFQAEVVAIEQGLTWVVKNCREGEAVMIRSDSQSAIQAILGPVMTSKLVLDCKKVLRQAKENHRIAIRWIKGHANRQ